MITQEEFEEKVHRFKELEDARGQIYDLAMRLINHGFELEAYLLILSTWNFAGFRYVLKEFDIDKFKKTIIDTNPAFRRLENEKFETADLDKLKEDISFIYNKLNSIVKQTGATKIMHFKNPNLFIMWDTNIRKKWKIPQTHTTAEDYIEFLRKMQKNFLHIKWDNNNGMSLARAIDAYNFDVTQEEFRSRKKK